MIALLLLLALLLFLSGGKKSRSRRRHLRPAINWTKIRRAYIDATFPRVVARWLH